MKIKGVIICLLVLSATFAVINVSSQYVSAQTLLSNGIPMQKGAPVPDHYQFDVLGADDAIIGMRPEAGDDFDVEVYEDTTFTAMIESSTTIGDAVDFVVLDKTTWSSPPPRGARVTSGSTSYVVEMENDVDDHLTSDTWSGSMDVSPGNPVLDIGPPGSWDDTYVYAPTVLYDGTKSHMWYGGFDGSNRRIGYATSPNGITWTKYSANPVLDIGPPNSWDDAEVYLSTVLYDGATYHMWYSGGDGTNYRIGYATSSDGILWTKSPANPVLNIGSPGSWDNVYIFSPMVLYDGLTYHMWYSGFDGFNRRIGHATSPDGISWTKYSLNPVLDIGPSGSWDDKEVFVPKIVYDGATYHMWYTGGDGTNRRIGYAISTDKINWAKSPVNPVLDIGPSGSWDGTHVMYPAVLYDGITYHIWYSGFDGPNARIGYATTTDVDNWIKSPVNPVVDNGPPGSWDDVYVAHPSVLYDGTKYNMWYGGLGSNVKIGYATSPDGITWTKYIANPVIDLGPSGSWEDYGVHYPTVLLDGTIYKMWYSGNDGMHYRIGYATSPDGITWTRYAGNPVLDLGPSGSFDDFYVAQPSVIYDGATYHMWYSGLNSVGYGRTGYATSPDGVTWTKSAANPVLDIGPSGSWDDTRAYQPEVIYEGGIYHMWYGGYDGSTYRIGYATSSNGIAWTKYAANPAIDRGPPGSWEDVHLGSPAVFYDGTMYHMWYSGEDGANVRIGYATYSITWTKLAPIAEVLDAYEITGFNAGSTYTIILDVPSTADLDLFICDTTGGRDDAVASSTNFGAGIDESITFTAPTTRDYLLVITNEDGGTGTYTVIQNNPPIADAGEDQIVYEGDTVLSSGTGSYDVDGNIETYEWDLDGSVDSDGDGNPTNDVDATGPTPTHVYGDNGIYTVTLKVTDDQDISDTDTCNITVLNVDPTLNIESVVMDVEISLRVAGSKWSNIGLTLYEDDNAIGYIEVERWPGNPDDNPYYENPTLPTTLDMTKSYKAIVTYDPYPDSGDEIKRDQPNNGKDKFDNAGNPVWIIIKLRNGSEERIHHTFNTQQSKKRNSEHWNHVEPWEVDLMTPLRGHPFEVTAHITDPGSDDETLTHDYGSQNVTITYLNNPPNPDAYPSPEINPRDIIDTTTLVYEGPGTLLLLVEDDDGGTVSAKLVLA